MSHDYCGSLNPETKTWCMREPDHQGVHRATVRDLRLAGTGGSQLRELEWGEKSIEEMTVAELFDRLRMIHFGP